jgi:hypothetical protein
LQMAHRLPVLRNSRNPEPTAAAVVTGGVYGWPPPGDFVNLGPR